MQNLETQKLVDTFIRKGISFNSFDMALLPYCEYIQNGYDINHIYDIVKPYGYINDVNVENLLVGLKHGFSFELLSRFSIIFNISNIEYLLLLKESVFEYTHSELKECKKFGLFESNFKKSLKTILEVRLENDAKRLNDARLYREGVVNHKLSKFLISESMKVHESSFNRIVRTYIKYADFSKCNYFTIREGKISYHPKPEKQEIVQGIGTWRKSGRQLSTFTKVLKMIFGKFYEPIIKLEQRKGLNIEEESLKLNIVNIMAKKVSFNEAYNLDMEGWSQKSCMNNESYYAIYEENPEVFQAYLFKDGSETVGRAYTVKSDGETFLDRVYFKNEKHLKSIKKLAEKRGWWTKKENSYNCTVFLLKERKCTPNDIKINAFALYSQSVPFIDTFCYMSDCCTILSVEPENMEYKLQNVNGNYEHIGGENHDGETELEDGEWVDSDDACYVEIGRHRHEWHHIEDCVTVESGSLTGYAHRADCIYNDNLGEWILDN